MAADIKTLLNKKGWTGDEVGKAIIYSVIDAYKQTLQGKDIPTELFSPAQLQKMINALKDRDQIKRYNRYVGLNNWLTQYQAVALAYYQQVDGEINRFLGIVTTAHAVEDEYKYIEQLPAIMTQKQYDEIRARQIEADLVDENGEELSHGVFNLVELAIEYFVKQLRDDPRKQNPLRALKKKYQNERVTSPRILSNYNEIWGEGYYTLPDGRRSDQMSEDEWRAALEEEYLKTHKLSVNGESASFEETIKHFSAERRITQAIGHFDGIKNSVVENMRDEDKLRQLQSRQSPSSDMRGLLGDDGFNCTWHYYDEPPADLTKWDVIEAGELFEYYPALAGEEYDTYAEQAEDFKAEFPELLNAIMSEIDKTFFKGETRLSALPLKEWASTVFSFRELYDKDFFGFRAFIDCDTSIFDGNQRALFNGIAILRPSDLLNKSRFIDERGYYTEPDRSNNMSVVCGLEQFTPLNEDYIANAERLEQGRIIIEDGYYYLLGYDKAIELIADFIDIPDFTLFRIGHEVIAGRIDALNSVAGLLYAQIESTDYRDEDAKKAKIQVLNDYFYPLKAKELTIPDEAIAQAKALLNDNMKAFEAQEGTFINLLAKRREEA